MTNEYNPKWDDFTDNTKIPKYVQCKGCVNASDDRFSLHYYKKGYCSIYDKPPEGGGGKPTGLCDGSVKCSHFEKVDRD